MTQEGNSKTHRAGGPRWPTHLWASCCCILGLWPVDSVDQFLLRYFVTHKCGALFDHLTDKDQRVLTFAARGVSAGDAELRSAGCC